MSKENLSEIEYDEITYKDMDSIRDMIVTAEAHNLTTEVIMSYGNSMAVHKDIQNSIIVALGSWDLL